LRKPLIAGNWKMNILASEAGAFLTSLAEKLKGLESVEVAVFPPFTALAAASEALSGSNIAYGAQNMHQAPSGAFTGEVSAAMLADLGCTYVLLGHSERRQYFGETGALIVQKARAALAAGLKPVICVGESLEEREAGKTETVLQAQLSEALNGLDLNGDIAIAYEPLWAIGTGVNATDQQAQEGCAFIRRAIAASAGKASAEKTRILYGGSVKLSNIDGLMAGEDIDGALIGGASLDIGFADIAMYGGN